jgi:hypothetical protein
MARIRVDTEDLKAKAKDFEAAADAFNRAGDEIAALAMAMPSYDGQLSGPARKAGFEIQSQAREMKAALANDALYLQKAAQDFEEVDNSIVDGLNNSSMKINDSHYNKLQNYKQKLSLTFSSKSGGGDQLGWSDDGTTITMWAFGKTVKLDKSQMTPEELEAFETYKTKVKDLYDDIMYFALALGVDFVAIGTFVSLCLVALGTCAFDAIPVGGWMKAAGEFIGIVTAGMGIVVSSTAALWEAMQVIGDAVQINNSWETLSKSSAVI